MRISVRAEAMEHSWSGRRCLGVLVLQFFLNASCDGQSVEYEKLITACEKVQIGDSEQAVREMMGKPMKC